MSVIISGDTGLAGAATGALNGTLGATTPSTVVATDLTTTGNTILGNASTDTLNVGNGGLVKDASGNVGIGVTPSAWDSIFKAIDTSTTASIFSASTNNNLGMNVYYNAGYKYKTTNSAAFFRVNAGAFEWNIAPSGTAGNPITFTQAMTLDASGNLLVGTTGALATASLAKFNVQATTGVSAIYATNSASFTSSVVQIGCGTNSGTGWNILEGYSANGGADQFAVKRFQIIGNGNVQNTNNSYGAISDIKLKENIVDTSPKLDKLLQVKIRNYNLKTDPDHKQIGVIAQELETVFPSLIEETEDKETVTKTREVDGVEEEYTEQVLTGEVTKSVKYSVFVPILIKAIQEQQVMIDELKAKVAALEAA
jgi:hypothetical protein